VNLPEAKRSLSDTQLSAPVPVFNTVCFGLIDAPRPRVWVGFRVTLSPKPQVRRPQLAEEVIEEAESAEAEAGAEAARLQAALQTPGDALDACDLCREDGAPARPLCCVTCCSAWCGLHSAARDSLSAALKQSPAGFRYAQYCACAASW